MSETAPTFDAWVEYCFTQGAQDSRDWSKGFDEARLDREEFFTGMDPSVVAAYLTRLFRHPAFIADRYTDQQIADGIGFIFRIDSEYFHTVREAEAAQQVACYQSIEPLYLHLFDKICCKRGSDPDGDYTQTLDVDGEVYMIWDMDCVEGAIMFETGGGRLVEPGLKVLENVLLRCRTSTCLMSALHGLGHILFDHPKACTRIIDDFLARRSPPDWVREYACQARTGYIL